MNSRHFCTKPAFLLMSFLVSVSAQPPSLTFTAIPDQDEATLTARADAVTNYLESYIQETCGVPISVTYNPVDNYQDAVDALLSKTADFGWYGGLTGVQAGLRSPPSVYLTHRIEDTQFTSVFVQGANLSLDGIEDVEGRSLAYGSASSTSGHLMPAYYLGQNDTTPSSAIFTGSHDATVDVVANGTVEVGALNSVVWNRRVSANTTGGTSVFYTTDEYVDYLWVAGAGIVESWNAILAAWNGTLPEGGVDCTDINGLLTQAFLDASADDSLGAALFAAYSTVGYVPIDSGEYDPIEETGCALGMIEEIYCSQPVPEDLGNTAGTSSNNATEKTEMAPPAEESQVVDATPQDLSVAVIGKDLKGALLSVFFVWTVGVLSLC